ncbi:MAG: hypothetical protein MZW92_48225 [Comamonadaceae bacterium]|nr:hypothetical protein [Comamonadaceae bacterium]
MTADGDDRTAIAVDGVLLLDKPVGMTSNAALAEGAAGCSARARRATPARSIRWPRGLLPLCLRRGDQVLRRPARCRQGATRRGCASA